MRVSLAPPEVEAVRQALVMAAASAPLEESPYATSAGTWLELLDVIDAQIQGPGPAALRLHRLRVGEPYESVYHYAYGLDRPRIGTEDGRGVQRSHRSLSRSAAE